MTDQSPFAPQIAEYERLRDFSSTTDDEAAGDAAYDRAAKLRDLIFATPALTSENAAAKARFLLAFAREREGDLSQSAADDALEDLARFIEKACPRKGAET